MHRCCHRGVEGGAAPTGVRSAGSGRFHLPATLVIVCEWPNVNVELSTATIGADRTREAAERARELWSDEDLPEWPG
jgi:hypothetical protein